MYINRVKLRDIRGIKSLELRLIDRARSQASTILIGRNGTGKSSILRALVLGLASETEATALIAEKFGSPVITVGESKGLIEVELVDSSGSLVYSSKKVIVRNGDADEHVLEKGDGWKGRRAPLVVGFGAGRSNSGVDSSRGVYSLVDSAYMLFNYDDTFIDPELTLWRLRDLMNQDVDQNVFAEILARIKRALAIDEDHELKLEVGGGVAVSGPDGSRTIPIDSWADGYRLTFNWLLDVYAWAMKYRATSASSEEHSSPKVIDENGYVSGILVLDEIDQHLHPTMQRTIVGHLKTLFPHMQIIASTHSPLVLQGAELHEIVSLHRSGTEVRSVALPDYSDYSAEDLLTSSELFDTPAYSVEIEDMRARYRELVVRTGKLSQEEEEQLRHAGKRLARLQILAPAYEEETLARLQSRLAELARDVE